jgi:hypothetical protein
MVTLNLTQLNDLLLTLTGGTNKVYVLTDNREIYINTIDYEGFIYDTIFGEYTVHPYLTLPTQLWMNKAPCDICVDKLEKTFMGRDKPIIYVESLAYNETNYGTLESSIGCLARLHGTFTIQPWNWSVFKAGLIVHDLCTTAIDDAIGANPYSSLKGDFTQFLKIYDAFSSNNTVGEWCK